ncbi:hypothetical protein P43SY_004218 [Pythium insidiosum]|uniref:W2 domain-containing protein n=1 Tax=Pythium insidiosum TaxID=114742 RepID=A0AAD5LHI9_PYTIN|nr:hypothetical protein P43SY_004218 [Pythium insidiosum]
MARRGKKMNLGEFLGDQTASFIPEAALPTGPRARDEFDGDSRGGYGGRGGDRFGDRRGGYDREPSRSEQSDQWRGDRGSSDRFGDRGGDRFSRGGSRFGDDDSSSWRGSRDGPSRYERPSGRDSFREPEERPAHMRLNLQRRGDSGAAPSSPRRGGASDDKFASAFGRSSGGASGGLRRFADERGSGDRWGSGRDRGYDDRDRGFGGRDRFDDRDRRGFSSSRFDRGYDDRRDDAPPSNAFGALRVNDNDRAGAPASRDDEPNEELDKKARAQKLREERKKKAEEEKKAAEEAKRKAAEEKKAKEEAEAAKADGDRAIMKEILASGKLGEELAAVAKKAFAASGRPSGGAVVETVTKQAEDVAKGSANWIAPNKYGELLKVALADAPVEDQVKAIYALQVFLNGHDFPKGVLEKCFMALYTLDIIEEKAFFDYKYDVDSDVPGRMKAIVQTSNWLTWLETPEEEDDEEDDE